MLSIGNELYLSPLPRDTPYTNSLISKVRIKTRNYRSDRSMYHVEYPVFLHLSRLSDHGTGFATSGIPILEVHDKINRNTCVRFSTVVGRIVSVVRHWHIESPERLEVVFRSVQYTREVPSHRKRRDLLVLACAQRTKRHDVICLR